MEPQPLPADYDVAREPWFGALDKGSQAEIAADALTFGATGRCIHGREAARLLLEWRLEAERSSCRPPSNWAGFDVKAESWFGYLDPPDQDGCVAEFAAIAEAGGIDAAKASEGAYWGWSATAFVCADPELRARLAKPKAGGNAEAELRVGIAGAGTAEGDGTPKPG